MPSYEFSKEILPNIWIGTKNALHDMNFRKKHYIIRDVIFESSFSNPTEPVIISNAHKLIRLQLNGNENTIQLKKICEQTFPFLDEAL